MRLSKILAEVANYNKYKISVELKNGEETSIIVPDSFLQNIPQNKGITIIQKLINKQNPLFKLLKFSDIKRFDISEISKDSKSNSFTIITTELKSSGEKIFTPKIEIFYKKGGGKLYSQEITDLENKADETKNSIIDNSLNIAFSNFLDILKKNYKEA